MPSWTDNDGASHPLKINGQKARQLANECQLDLMRCLVKTGHIQVILEALAESPETLMAACACVEHIPARDLDDYYGLWDGDAFESASVALLEAIADFFPQRPRQILTTLISKMKQASQMIGDKAVQVATQQIDQMDFYSALKELKTHGNGGTGSAESSAPVRNY